MKITHRITLCDECGLEWVKPFWEPRWVSRVAANEIHDDYHRGWKDPEHHEIVESWREWERERIIEILDGYYALTMFSVKNEGAKPNDDWDSGFNAAIALIKADNE